MKKSISTVEDLGLLAAKEVAAAVLKEYGPRQNGEFITMDFRAACKALGLSITDRTALRILWEKVEKGELLVRRVPSHIYWRCNNGTTQRN